MIIPHDELAPETLHALIEEFVTRQGAVHGHVDEDAARYIKSVMSELRSGKAVIVFDEEEESCSIMRKEELR
jgi:uncharacterized protein YheU (UPF0270 family)